jgi:hypothetical protein
MKIHFITLLFILSSNFAMSDQEKFQDLKSIDELQKQFTSDAGKVRIIALLSPT